MERAFQLVVPVAFGIYLGDQLRLVRRHVAVHGGFERYDLVDGDVIEVIQLKAVVSPAAILEHLAKYPDIGVAATSEVAARVSDVSDSGFANAKLDADVNAAFSALPEDSYAENLAEAAGGSVLVSGAFAAAQTLRSGRVSKRQLSEALGDIGVAAVAATTLDALIDGLS